MFEFEKLELRFYPREELAKIAGLDAHDHNFAATMKDRLTLWGYEYTFQRRRGFTITRIPTTPEERLMEILRRDVRIDTQVDVLKFACFMSAFVLIPDFLAMPWRTRETMLWEYFAVSVCGDTMRNWRDKMIECGYIYPYHSVRTLWHTSTQNGRKVQEPADPESDEYKTYCKLRSGILSGYAAMGISSRTVWGDMVHQLYKEHGVFYYCKSIEFNGFKLEELDYIHDLTLEILRTKPD